VEVMMRIAGHGMIAFAAVTFSTTTLGRTK